MRDHGGFLDVIVLLARDILSPKQTGVVIWTVAGASSAARANAPAVTVSASSLETDGPAKIRRAEG